MTMVDPIITYTLWKIMERGEARRPANIGMARLGNLEKIEETPQQRPPAKTLPIEESVHLFFGSTIVEDGQ